MNYTDLNYEDEIISVVHFESKLNISDLVSTSTLESVQLKKSNTTLKMIKDSISFEIINKDIYSILVLIKWILFVLILFMVSLFLFKVFTHFKNELYSGY